MIPIFSSILYLVTLSFVRSVFDIFICLIVSLFGFFAFFIFFFVKIPLSKQNHGPHHQCQKSHDSRRSIHQAVDTADVLRFNRVYLITDIWLRN